MRGGVSDVGFGSTTNGLVAIPRAVGHDGMTGGVVTAGIMSMGQDGTAEDAARITNLGATKEIRTMKTEAFLGWTAIRGRADRPKHSRNH